jgi:hypothetical protein
LPFQDILAFLQQKMRTKKNGAKRKKCGGKISWNDKKTLTEK